MAPIDVPEHPFLDNGGDSRVHNDHYNSAAYNREGPMGPEIDITTITFSKALGSCSPSASGR